MRLRPRSEAIGGLVPALRASAMSDSMYAAVLPRLSLCALLGGIAPALRGGALSLALSGCALIGYDLGAVEGAGAGRTGDGSSGTAAANTAGAKGAGMGAGAGRGGGSAAGDGGRGGQAGADADASAPIAGSGGDADASSGADAAADGGVGDDAGLLPDPCPGMPDGTPCDINSFCKSDMNCSNGRCAGVTDRDCSEFDQGCTEGVCIEAERRCVPKDVADGTNCGPGRTCSGGVCSGSGCVADQSCDLSCDGEDCALDCEQAATCTIVCTADSDCDVGCQDIDECVGACESSTCDFDCRGAVLCNAVCTDSSCRIRCEDAGNCNAIVCATGASCVIECGADTCAFALCAAGDEQQCPDGVLVCGTDCP
jgi:hypothetical protein